MNQSLLSPVAALLLLIVAGLVHFDVIRVVPETMSSDVASDAAATTEPSADDESPPPDGPSLPTAPEGERPAVATGDETVQVIVNTTREGLAIGSAIGRTVEVTIVGPIDAVIRKVESITRRSDLVVTRAAIEPAGRAIVTVDQYWLEADA